MRALFVIHYPVYGGPHNGAAVLRAPLAERGIELTVLLPDEPGGAAERLRAEGVDVRVTELARLRATTDPAPHRALVGGFARQVREIRRIIRDEGIGVVVIGGLVNPHAAIAARAEGVPVVWQLLDSRPPMWLRRATMPFVVALGDAVMTTGVGIATAHPGALRFGERLFPYFMGVDVKRFRPDPELRRQARAELGLPAEALVIGNVSNLNPQKDHRTFIRAAALLSREHPDVRFVILGATYDTHAGYIGDLMREARDEGLFEGDRLVVRDPGREVAELASAFDVFWMTSGAHSEGTPTVVGEAMALGLPVVATAAGATDEVVRQGETGYLTSPGAPAEIVAATVPLISDEALRARLGEAARQRAVELFSAEACADLHVRAIEAAAAHRARDGRRVSILERAPADGAGPPDVFAALRCPGCGGELSRADETLGCASCDAGYPIVDGIPVMVQTGGADADALKAGQAAFFDEEADPEYEIRRPRGTPALHRALLEEKYRRSVSALEALLPGAAVLTTCGGSGMEAEFLARSGARVVVSDISLGAVKRAVERGRRYGLPIAGVVADAERLPFADRSFDVTYVHDGLHHLGDPLAGLDELARVARTAVSVTEPARAAATQVAVRLGISENVEEAGNPVARMSPEATGERLARAGLKVVAAERYAMFYRHEPGAPMRLLSRPRLLGPTRRVLGAFNLVAGGTGNKMTVQAVRVAIDAPRSERAAAAA